MNISFICDNGHDVDIDIPGSVAREMPIIVPCPTCKLKYIVDGKGNAIRYKRKMMHFPTLNF